MNSHLTAQEPTIQRRTATASVLTIVGLLFAFGFIAQEVAIGKTSTFDRQVILAFRTSTDPSVLIGPEWLPEAARDATSLGSIVVVGIITLAVAGYLLLAGKPPVAWLMLIVVAGGIAVSDLLKFARVFTTSFPSGRATLSAKPALIRSKPLLHVVGGISDRRYRREPNIPLEFTIRLTFWQAGASAPLGPWGAGRS